MSSKTSTPTGEQIFTSGNGVALCSGARVGVRVGIGVSVGVLVGTRVNVAVGCGVGDGTGVAGTQAVVVINTNNKKQNAGRSLFNFMLV